MGSCCQTGGGGCRPPRLPSVLCAILCSAAYATALLSGVTCTFLRVYNTPIDNAPIVADAPSEFYETAFPPNYSLGVYCPPPHSSVEVDTLWLTARIFLSVGLTIGLINLALSLATCTPLMSPTKTNWKAMGVLSALAGSVQVPAFLMFDSSSCHHRSGEERYYTSSCQMDLGSFLLVCSVAIQLCITAFTQCVDAPEYDVEEERKLDAWRKNPDGRDAKSWDMSSVNGTAPGTPLSRSSDINDVEIGRRQDEAMRRGGARGNCLTRCWSGRLGLKDRGNKAGVHRGGRGRRPGENDGEVDGGDGGAAVAAAVGSVAATSRVRRGKKRKPTKRAKAGPPPSRHVRSTSEGSRSVEVLKRSATQLAEDDDVEALELDQVDEEDEADDDDDDEISQMRRSGPYDEESGRDLLGIEASPLRRKTSEQRIDGSKTAAGVPTMASERTLQTSNHSNDKNDETNGVRVGLVEQRRREVSARLLGTSSSTSTHDAPEGGATKDDEGTAGVEQAPPKATTPQRRSIQEKKRGDATTTSSSSAAAAAGSEGRPPPSPRKASRSTATHSTEGGNAMTAPRDRREMSPPVRREMATDQEMPPPPQRQSLSSRIASMFRGGDRAYDVMNDSGSSVVSSNHGDSSVVRNSAVAAATANTREEQEILRGGSRRHVQMRLSETNKQTISMMDVVAVRQSSVADMSVETVSVAGGGSGVVVTPSYDNEDGGSSCYTTASEGGDRDDGAADLTDSGAGASGNADVQDDASEAPFDEGRPPSVGPAARDVGGVARDTMSNPPTAASDDDGVASSVAGGGGGAPSEVPFDELLDRARRGVALGRARRASSVSASKTRGVGGGGGTGGGGGSSPRSLTKEAWRNNRRGHSVAPSAPSHFVGASASLTTTTPPRTPVKTDRVQPQSTALATPESSKGPPGRGGVQEQPSTPIGSREGNNAASRRRGRSVTPRTMEVSSSAGQRPREEERGAHRGGEEEQNPSVGTGVVKSNSTSSTPRRGRSVSALRSVWEGNKDQSSSGGVAPSPTNNRTTPQRRRGNSVTPGVSRDENGPLNGVATRTSRNAIPPSPSRRNQTQSIDRTPERSRSQSVTPGSRRAAAESGTPETAREDDPDHRQSTAGASPVVGRSAPSRERRGQSISATSRGQSVNRNNGPTPPRSRSVAPPGSPWAGGDGQPAAASDEAGGSSSLTPSRRGRSTTPRSRAMAGAMEGGQRAPSGPPPPSPQVQGKYQQASSGTTIGSVGKDRNDGDDEDEDRQSAVGSYLDRLGKKMDGGRKDKDAKLKTPSRLTPPPPPPTRTPGTTTFEKAKNETDYSEEAVSRTSSAVVSPDVSPSSTTGSSHDEISSPPRRHQIPTPTSSSFFRRTNPSPSPNHRYGSMKSYGTSAMSPRAGKVAGETIEPSPKPISGGRAHVVTPERSEPPTSEARAASPPRITPSSSSHRAPPRYGSLVDARKQMFERKSHRSDDSSEASSAAELRNGSRSVSVSRRQPPQQHVSQSPHRRVSSVTPQPRSEMDKVSII